MLPVQLPLLMPFDNKPCLQVADSALFCLSREEILMPILAFVSTQLGQRLPGCIHTTLRT